MPVNKAFLLLGSNLADRDHHLILARELLERYCGTISAVSHLYETAAWGKTDQPDFLNQAVQLNTIMNARQLIRRILKIEKTMGRIRKEKFGPRIIDIDILLFNDEVYDYPFLKVPHPELQNRRFALVPLAEIAPDLLHPVLKKSVISLLENCKDQLEVRKYS